MLKVNDVPYSIQYTFVVEIIDGQFVLCFGHFLLKFIKLVVCTVLWIAYVWADEF